MDQNEIVSEQKTSKKTKPLKRNSTNTSAPAQNISFYFISDVPAARKLLISDGPHSLADENGSYNIQEQFNKLSASNLLEKKEIQECFKTGTGKTAEYDLPEQIGIITVSDNQPTHLFIEETSGPDHIALSCYQDRVRSLDVDALKVMFGEFMPAAKSFNINQISIRMTKAAGSVDASHNVAVKRRTKGSATYMAFKDWGFVEAAGFQSVAQNEILLTVNPRKAVHQNNSL